MFSKDRTCEWLAAEIRQACDELKYLLWAYVFMPDHIHLIVCPREKDYDTSDFLKRFKEPVSRNAVQFLKREAPDWLLRLRVVKGTKVEHHFWQPGRGHDRNITNGRTLRKMMDYVHQNPVRSRLVEQARDWKWSSAGWYEEAPMNDLKPDPIPWDRLEDQ